MATYLSRQLSFQIFCGSRRDPSKVFLLSSMRRCQQWFLLASQPPPVMPAPTSPSNILCAPGAQHQGALGLLPGSCSPLLWPNLGDELPKTPPQPWGAVRERAWALLRWGKAWRRKTASEAPQERGKSPGLLGRRHPEGAGCTS